VSPVASTDAHGRPIAAERTLAIGVDIGGTCTDCVVIDGDGPVTVGKVFSTPADFSQGIFDAVAVAAEKRGTSLAELLRATRLFLHSTTVAENAILEGELVPTGLLVTRGHRDTLFATRGGFGRWSGLREDEKRNPTDTRKPSPLVSRTRTRTIRERTDVEGEMLVPLAEGEVEEAVHSLLGDGVRAIGICFLWSFANPQNELVAKETIERIAPGIFVTASYEVAPVSGEYERASTVALNAGLGPVVSAYLERLAGRLRTTGFAGTLLVMQAYGGLLPAERARRRPVGLVESGPVSGLIGGQKLGELLGFRNLISADLGGTTFKVGIVRDGLVEYQRESLVARYHYSLPKLDIESLGIAGGSIVSVDSTTGVPRVGPQSAGSYPGPVAYGHGGTDPTVTDVDVILGFMNPDFFLEGREQLHPEAARTAFERTIAVPLDLGLLDAAAAIHRLVNSHIYDLLHRMTIQRGLDPRSFALFSVGGTAGMHLPEVAFALGIPTVVVPYTASVQGAFGLVSSDVVHEELVARPLEAPGEIETVQGIFDELEQHVLEQLSDEGFGPDDIDVQRSIDMRYRRQVHVVTAPVTMPGRLTDASLSATIDLFESLYREKYGPDSTYREAGIEFVTFRTRASGRVPRVDPSQFGNGTPVHGDGAYVGTREVRFSSDPEPIAVPGYALERLDADTSIAGPALVWSPVTTVVVNPGLVAQVDAYRNIVIRRVAGGGS
jgi:N-methylhydantoinase A